MLVLWPGIITATCFWNCFAQFLLVFGGMIDGMGSSTTGKEGFSPLKT